MSILPTVFSFLSDGHVAAGRIANILKADEQPPKLAVYPEQELAIQATGDFEFDTTDSKIDIAQGWTHVVAAVETVAEEANALVKTATLEDPEKHEFHKHFALRDIDLRIPRGALVVILGRVGGGKSALLQGLLGEMKQTRGHVTFGGSVSLVTQIPWIQSASVKDNILFGQKEDEQRLRQVVRACALEHDLKILSNGMDTEIGGKSEGDCGKVAEAHLVRQYVERGINLSGGQRSRLSLARAVYSDAEILLLDDPLSAVDSHGKLRG